MISCTTNLTNFIFILTYDSKEAIENTTPDVCGDVTGFVHASKIQKAKYLEDEPLFLVWINKLIRFIQGV